VPVHALGYILIVFEVIILSGRIVREKSLNIFFSIGSGAMGKKN
jgi:hypothetical protein